LVLVPVHVTDGDGKTIGDLTRDHFQIFDEGAPREIVSFTTEEAPVSLGIVMDLSASMQAKLPQAISALREATGRFGPGDEAFLLTFSSHPSLRQGFTGDVASLTDNLQFARTEGRTALVDAVYQALEQVRRGRNPRKALLVISDGGDNNSRYRESELLEAALESNTQIYTIAIHEQRFSPEERSGAYLLQKLATSTGGLHFDLQSRHELPKTGEKIARALKNVYMIGYKPPAESTSGKWRRIRIRLTQNPGNSFHVSARSGYYCLE
jgi:Ca-activated chloride channel family protein